MHDRTKFHLARVLRAEVAKLKETHPTVFEEVERYEGILTKMVGRLQEIRAETLSLLLFQMDPKDLEPEEDSDSKSEDGEEPKRGRGRPPKEK